jgi:hypothetical protein
MGHYKFNGGGGGVLVQSARAGLRQVPHAVRLLGAKKRKKKTHSIGCVSEAEVDNYTTLVSRVPWNTSWCW